MRHWLGTSSRRPFLPHVRGPLSIHRTLRPAFPSFLTRLTRPLVKAREVLESDPEFAGLDFSALTPEWTSKAGFYAATEEAIAARARWVRHWLRSRPEQRIVVVSHGDCLRYITKGHNTHEPWANCEVREYTFAVDEADDQDGEAWLVPVKKQVAVEGEPEPTSSEQAGL